MKKYDYLFFGNDACNIRLLHNVECYDHLHFQTEAAIALKGELTVNHEKSKIVLNKRQAVFIMPYEMHAYNSVVGTDAVIIVFNGMQFDEFADKGGFGGVKFEISEQTAQYVASLSQSKDNRSPLALKAAVYPILNDFYNCRGKSDAVSPYSEIYKMCLKYIDDNYFENINLKTAAAHVGCSYVYLSRLFSATAGMSFTAYLSRYRIIKSISDLKKSDLPITEIALKNGFGSPRSYNREFRKIFDMTPSDYKTDGFDFHVEG